MCDEPIKVRYAKRRKKMGRKIRHVEQLPPKSGIDSELAGLCYSILSVSKI